MHPVDIPDADRKTSFHREEKKKKHIARNTNRSHRYSARDRRAARVRISLVLACALGVLLAWVGVWHEVLPWKSQSGGVALAEAPPTNDPSTT
ncbi:MAG: hypothetical protein IID42_11915 [Planctomycetes bacterium]|nr:hypothetical protein [Planctomycetota bacterium]